MFDFYAQLRSGLIGLVFSVQNSESCLPWEETKTNRTIRRELETLLIANVHNWKIMAFMFLYMRVKNF